MWADPRGGNSLKDSEIPGCNPFLGGYSGKVERVLTIMLPTLRGCGRLFHDDFAVASPFYKTVPTRTT